MLSNGGHLISDEFTNKDIVQDLNRLLKMKKSEQGNASALGMWICLSHTTEKSGYWLQSCVEVIPYPRTWLPWCVMIEVFLMSEVLHIELQ